MKYLIPALLLITACDSFPCAVPKLELEQQPHTSSLRIDGMYYYYDYLIDSSSVAVLYLYGNGVLRMRGLSTEDAFKKDARGIFENINPRDEWGIYNVVNDSINIEKWEPSLHCGADKVSGKGWVLNDSTIVVELYPSYEEVYHFYPLDVKPDSTNEYLNP